MGSHRNIHVFWWSSVKFENKPQENFGDMLSKYLVEKISGKQVVWKHPKKKNWSPFKKKIHVTTGSILAHVTKDCVVWGSGIISRKDTVSNATFLAVRGPETYAYLKHKGYRVNKVFGDPAILLPDLYQPKTEKQYKLGIIPHYVDYDKVSEWYHNDSDIKVINLLNNNVESVIDDILKCEKIISSSLHGVIVSQAYQIPAIWVEFSKKLSGDGVKFDDYFKSVSLEPYNPPQITEKIDLVTALNLINQFPNLPNIKIMDDIRKGLIDVCPFKHV